MAGKTGLARLGYGVSDPAATAAAKNVNTFARPTGRAYGGALAAGGASAALGSVATSNSSDEQPSNQSPAGTALAESGFELPSLQHLEAPLNAAITGWLQQYQPNLGALFQVTGLKPLQLVDAIVSRLHRRGAPATSEAVNAAALDVVDSAKERAAIQSHDQLYQEGRDLSQTMVHSDMATYSNARMAIATVQLAADTLPGGMRDLIKLRAAFELDKAVFDEAIQLSEGFHPGDYFGVLVQNQSEAVRLR